MKKSFHIELIATDGAVQKRVLWAHAAPNGVYCGLCAANGEDCHVTYHADGNVFNNFGGKTNKVYTGKKFSEFKGHFTLLWSGVTSNLSHGFYPHYSLKKVNALVTVDIRNYKQDIGCFMAMVEPSFEGLSSLMNSVKSMETVIITELHAFMECNPWIVFALWSNK